MNEQLKAYYKGVKNPDGKTRYDVVTSFGDYSVFEEGLLNRGGFNVGGLSWHFFLEIPERIGSNQKRKGDYHLNKTNHISSIYHPDKSIPVCWGDVMHPKTRILTKDAIIIILSPDFTEIEIFVAPGLRNESRILYQQVIDGLLDDEIEWLRGQSLSYSNVA